jgi:alkylhydroperoxidase/carboxymuconolactone decarboxylase family protein YurZ
MFGVSRICLRRGELLLLRLKARRSGVWFKALSRLDRALINLAIKVAYKVRSQKLAEALLNVINKVKEAVGNSVSQAIYMFGFPIARKLGLLAKKWGNPFAESWMSDVSFARFLAIMHINNIKAHSGAIY